MNIRRRFTVKITAETKFERDNKPAEKAPLRRAIGSGWRGSSRRRERWWPSASSGACRPPPAITDETGTRGVRSDRRHPGDSSRGWRLPSWLSSWPPCPRPRPPRPARRRPTRCVSRGRPSPRPGRRPALLLPRRHRVVALPPPDPRGGRPLPAQPGGQGLHRDPGRRPLGDRRPAHAERLRRATARGERPAAAERGVLRPRRLGRGPRGGAGPHRRPPPHLGRQVAQPAERAGAEGLHRRRHRPRLRALHRPAVRVAPGDLRPRRRPERRDAGGPRDHAGLRGGPEGDGPEGARHLPPPRARAAPRTRSTASRGSTST